MSSGCCNCCAYTSLVGVVFFGITAIMVQRQNTVFLTHKAGIDLHEITDEAVEKKLIAMLYTVAVFAGAMLCCFGSSFGLKKREDRIQAALDDVKKHNAKVAFEAAQKGDDDFQAAH